MLYGFRVHGSGFAARQEVAKPQEAAAPQQACRATGHFGRARRKQQSLVSPYFALSYQRYPVKLLSQMVQAGQRRADAGGQPDASPNTPQPDGVGLWRLLDPDHTHSAASTTLTTKSQLSS